MKGDKELLQAINIVNSTTMYTVLVKASNLGY